MASKYAGTKTEQNLKDAFSGESQARNKYTYYASAAKKAGYEQMSALYLETADQEKEHARIWLTQQQVRITSGLICMHAWPVKHGKKASRNWLLSLNWLPRLRLHMREGITSC